MIKSTVLLAVLIAMSAMPQTVAQETGHYGPLVDANTRFAFKFFREALLTGPDRNTLAAPAALSGDFAFLQNGADAESRNEILSAFELGRLSSQEINEQSLALRKALSYMQTASPRSTSHLRPKENAAPQINGTAEHLVLAGSLWGQPVVGFRSQFIKTGKEFFSFETVSVPNNGPAAARAVNAWIARQTDGVLTDVLDSWRKDDFLLVDTTWFRGAWRKPFLAGKTHLGDFTLPTGQKKPVQLMAQGGDFAYFRGQTFQAVCLPYHRAAMYVFLPDEGSSLQEFERSLSADKWTEWLPNFIGHEGYLELPRFHSEFRTNVTAILKDLGVERAFTNSASFAPAVSNPEGAVLTRVLQAITLSVDEKGTEVASAGIIGGVPGGVSAGPRPEPFRMIVNRPFFFVVRDDQTGTILYMGAIVDP